MTYIFSVFLNPSAAVSITEVIHLKNYQATENDRRDS